MSEEADIEETVALLDDLEALTTGVRAAIVAAALVQHLAHAIACACDSIEEAEHKVSQLPGPLMEMIALWWDEWRGSQAHPVTRA